MKQNRFFFKATTNVKLLSSYRILAWSAKRDLKPQLHQHAQIGDGSFVSLLFHPNRWCLTPSQPLQRTKQCCKSRGKSLMHLALCSISTSLHISRNKRCQKGQIWVSPWYIEKWKFPKTCLYLSLLAILECVHLVLLEKQVNTRHVQLHTQTHWGCWNSEAKSSSCSGSVVSIQPWCSGTCSPRAVSALFPQSHTKHKWHLAGTSWLPTCPSEFALNSADTCEYGFQSHYCFPLPGKGRDSPSPIATQPSPPHFHLADAALTLKLQLDPTALSWTLCSSRTELEEPPDSSTNPRVLWTRWLCLPACAPGTAGRAGSRAGSWSRDSLGAGPAHGTGPVVVLRGFCLGFQTLPLFTAHRQMGRLSLAP